MLRVNKDDFEVFVGRVLVDPVGVEDTKIGAAAADTLFGGGTKGSLVLELVHTLVGGFAFTPSARSVLDENCLRCPHRK